MNPNMQIKSLFVLLIAIATTFSACNKPITPYEKWKGQGATNIRLLPKYGHAEKTVQQKEADAEFIKTTTKELTPQAASEKYVEFGFKYLNEGNPQTAMYRFNQAWLLDAKNPGVYWGFGSVYFSFKDYKNAVNQYNEGLSIDPGNKGILKDRALAIQLLKKALQKN